jgi:hypothetical protein
MEGAPWGYDTVPMDLLVVASSFSEEKNDDDIVGSWISGLSPIRTYGYEI